MEFQVKTDEQPLLKRTQIRGTVSYSGVTPTRKDVRTALAHHVKGKEELLIVRVIKPVFGHQRSKILASLYHERAALDAQEPVFLRRIHGLVAEASKDAKAQAKGEPAKEAA